MSYDITTKDGKGVTMPHDKKLPVLVEDVFLGDWIRQGPRAVEELLIAHRSTNPCAIARQMRESGQAGALIFKSLIDACREYRKKQGR